VESYDEKAFHLAAENYKDQVVQASLALNKSNWASVCDSVFKIKQITSLPEFQTGELKELLIQRIKLASLKTFMCKGSKSYQTFSIKSLANIFEMEEKQVKKFISKMILRN